MRNKIKIDSIITNILVILAVSALLTLVTVITVTKSSIKSIINDEKQLFIDTIDEDLYIDNIYKDNTTFMWEVNSNIDKSIIKGFRYKIEINNTIIDTGITYTNSLSFVPKYNGEFTLSINVICDHQVIGPAKQLNFIIKEDNLSTFTLVENSELLKLFNNSELSILLNDLLITSGNVSIFDKLELYNELEKLPIDILYKLKDNKFKIHQTSYDLTGIHNSNLNKSNVKSITIGLFNPKTKTIHLNNGEGYIKKSSIHEIGHCIDYILGVTNYHSELNSEFTNIFNKEKNAIDSEYYKSNIREFFAYSFSEFINNPSDLYKRQPETFNHITNILNVLPIRSKINQFLDTLIYSF